MKKIAKLTLVAALCLGSYAAAYDGPGERGKGMGPGKGKWKNMSLEQMKSKLGEKINKKQVRLDALKQCQAKNSKQELRQCMKAVKAKYGKGKRKGHRMNKQ